MRWSLLAFFYHNDICAKAALFLKKARSLLPLHIDNPVEGKQKKTLMQRFRAPTASWNESLFPNTISSLR